MLFIQQIADQKGAESLKAFKFNEAKTLNWLSLKCKKLATALQQQNFHIGAKSLNYVKTEKFDQQPQNGKIFGIFHSFFVFTVDSNLVLFTQKTSICHMRLVWSAITLRWIYVKSYPIIWDWKR